MTEQDYKEKSAAIKESGMPLDIQKYFQRLTQATLKYHFSPTVVM